MIGEVVGSYRITEKIATGGMGVVYKAEHTLIGKTAAVKVLRREYSENRDIMDRFFREAQSTTTVRHPGIVDIFDFGYFQNERAYIIMEYLAGETLKERLRARGVLAADVATRLIRSVASAVGAAHKAGIIHRDLKPDNILLVPDPDMPDGERIKVLDFGLAKLTDAHSATMGTQAGLVLGTPTYMAPEQCAGEGAVDARADLYALGCILFQLVCGRPPFESQGGFARILMAHMQQPPPLPRTINGAIPESLERIILKLLAKSPDERFQTMSALRQALDECAAELSDIPVAILVESTEDTAASGPQPSHPGSRESSYVSTLGASAGQIVDASSQGAVHESGRMPTHLPGHGSSHPGMHGSGMHGFGQSGVHGSGMHGSGQSGVHGSGQSGMRGSGQSGVHGSGVRQESSVAGGASRPRRRLAMLPWVLGGAASILLGMGLVLVLASGRDASRVATGAAIDSDTTDILAEHEARAGSTAAPDDRDTGEPTQPVAEPAVGEPEQETDTQGAGELPAGAGAHENAAEVPTEESDMGEDMLIELDPDPVSPAATVEGEAEPVKIRLNLHPPTATVVVDGEVHASNPLTLVPRERPYRIEVRAKGFQSETRRLRADRDRSLKIALEPTRIDLDL